MSTLDDMIRNEHRTVSRVKSLNVLGASIAVAATLSLGAVVASSPAQAQQVPHVNSSLRCVNLATGAVRNLHVNRCPRGWVQEASAGGVASAKRSKYLSTARSLNSDLFLVGDDTLFSIGKSTCQVLDKGGNFDDIVLAIIDSGLDPLVGAAITVAAVEELCPGHKQFLDNWLNT